MTLCLRFCTGGLLVSPTPSFLLFFFFFFTFFFLSFFGPHVSLFVYNTIRIQCNRIFVRIATYMSGVDGLSAKPERLVPSREASKARRNSVGKSNTRGTKPPKVIHLQAMLGWVS